MHSIFVSNYASLSVDNSRQIMMDAIHPTQPIDILWKTELVQWENRQALTACIVKF